VRDGEASKNNFWRVTGVANQAGIQGETFMATDFGTEEGKTGQVNSEVVGLSASQVEALFNLFKERERQEKMSGESLHSQSLQWILDTDPSHHMTPNIQVLENIYNLSTPINIAQPDGGIFSVTKAGNVNIGGVLTLKGVLYIPTFKCNLISVQKLTEDEK